MDRERGRKILERNMNFDRIAYFAKIIKAITPIIFKLVDDVEQAKQLNSDGGRKVTKQEIEKIIVDHVMDIPQIITIIINS